MSDMTHLAKLSDFRDLDGQQLLETVNRTVPRWVALLLVICIGWQLARVFWMLVPAPATGDPVSVQPTASSSAGSESQANVRLIASSHLFGEASIADQGDVPAPTGPDTEALPDARVTFSLKGTVAATDSNRSVAIIADSSNEEKVYKIGDLVQPGTKLHEIHRDLVVLNQNGSLSKLELPKDFPAGSPSVRRSSATVNRTSAITNNVNSIQNVVTENVSKLADVIRPTPYFVGGQQQGYRVYPGRDRKQFAALGLRPGDLIKDIDGAALNDPKQAMEIFQNLGNAEEVSVTVERNGQPQTLVLKTSQLQLDRNTQ